MKKTLTFFALILSLAAIVPFIPVKTAFADEITAQSSDNAFVSEPAADGANSSQAAQVASSDNQVIFEDEPVILPTNPFYFTKEYVIANYKKLVDFSNFN